MNKNVQHMHKFKNGRKKNMGEKEEENVSRDVVKLKGKYRENKATSDLSLTITGYVPHLIIVREEGKVDKTGFLRKKPLSCIHTYMHVSTHAYTCIYKLKLKKR